MSFGESGGDGGDGAGVVGEVDAEDVGLVGGGIEFSEDVSRVVGVGSDDAENAVLDGVHHGHGEDVDLFGGEGVEGLCEDAWFVYEEHGELCGDVHHWVSS